MTEVEVGVEGRRVELVLVEPDRELVRATLQRLVGTHDVWSTILSVEAPIWDLPAGVVERLTGERLMVADLVAAPTPPAPLGRVEVEIDGGRAVVRLVDGEVVAAQGQVALVGTDAVVDRVRTAEEYQRLGLGTVVMRTLEAWATSQGAGRGILAASPEGQALYGRLGWRAVGEMLTLVGAGPSDGA